VTKEQPKKQDAFATVQKKLDTAFGGKIHSLTRDSLRMNQAAIPTGIDVVDHFICGCGGFPCGSRGITELFSVEGGGKSSLVYALLGNAQALDILTFLADTEFSLSPIRAVTFNVDPDRVSLLEPDHMQEAFSMFETCFESLPPGVRGVVAWDSLAATPTKEEVNEGLSDSKAVFDVRAKLISRSLRVLNAKVARSGGAFVVVNQPRNKIGVKFGDPTTTPGGQALKSTASLRLQLYPGLYIERKGIKIGRQVTISVKKSRFSPPRKAVLRLLFDDGFDNLWSTLALAKVFKIITDKAKGTDAVLAAYQGLSKLFPGFPSKPSTQALNNNAEEEEETLVQPPPEEGSAEEPEEQDAGGNDNGSEE
jgi:recombination protein RecA